MGSVTRNQVCILYFLIQEKEARVKKMKEQIRRETEEEERKLKLDKEAAIK